MGTEVGIFEGLEEDEEEDGAAISRFLLSPVSLTRARSLKILFLMLLRFSQTKEDHGCCQIAYLSLRTMKVTMLCVGVAEFLLAVERKRGLSGVPALRERLFCCC